MLMTIPPQIAKQVKLLFLLVKISILSNVFSILSSIRLSLIPNPQMETRDDVQDIGFTVKLKILVAPAGSAAIFCFAVESRACAAYVFLSGD